MSLKEILQCVHDLTNTYQAVLSAIELGKYRIALQEIRNGKHHMIQLQLLVRAMMEEENETIQ